MGVRIEDYWDRENRGSFILDTHTGTTPSRVRHKNIPIKSIETLIGKDGWTDTGYPNTTRQE